MNALAPSHAAPPHAAIAPPRGLLRAILEWDPRRHPWWLRALATVLLTLGAAWLRATFAPTETGGRYISLTLMGALCALYGGFRMGMFSTVLGMFMINVVLVEPYLGWAMQNPVEAISLNLWHFTTQFVVVGAISVMQRQYRLLRESLAMAQRAHQQMLDTFEHSATGMAHARVDGSLIRVNQTYCDLLGYTREELHQSNWRRYTHPDDLPLDLGEMQRLVRGEIDHYTIEKRYIHKQGHVVWVVLSIALMRHPDGSPDYEIVVVQDISGRKATEEALRTSERLLSQAQQLAGMASWRYDTTRRVFTALANSTEVLGLPTAHFSDQAMLDMAHPDDVPLVRRRWAEAIAGTRPYDIEYRLRLGTEYRWYSVRAEFERDAQGRATVGLGVLHDITARKQAEIDIRHLNASLERRIQERTQALKAAYDELESYSYAVAHDLRSPLRIINGFAQALEEDNPDLNTESCRHLQRIRDASRRMGELIDGLLKLSQMARGELQREPVDLSAIATRQLRELAAAEPNRQVDWQVQAGLLAMGDTALVQALLQNLLHNAWKYTSQTPRARIRVFGREHQGVLQFVVEDNGAGFEMSRASKLFQPFQRLHPPGEFAGLGIGLATARRIVLRHGGEMSADAAPGQGARFGFTLQPTRAPADAPVMASS